MPEHTPAMPESISTAPMTGHAPADATTPAAAEPATQPLSTHAGGAIDASGTGPLTSSAAHGEAQAPTLPMNVATAERIASVAAGAALFLVAARQRRGPALVTAALAAGLVARGVTGRSAIYRAAGIDTRDTDTRHVLGGPGGVIVSERVRINKPIGELYRFWRDLTNLPRFMSHLRSVTVLDDRRSHWVAAGPAGTSLEWDAEIINDVPDKVIGWKSLEQADVVSAGSVNFDEPPGMRGTIVSVRLQYDPPAGRAGAWTAWLLGADPATQIREDLRRLKQLLEAGEVPTTEGQPQGGTAPRPHAPERARAAGRTS